MVSTRPHQKLVAAVANYEAVLQYQRCSDRDQCCNDWWYYTLLVKRKLHALRNGALFTGLPPALQQLRGGLLHQAGRDRFRVRVLNTARLNDSRATGTCWRRTKSPIGFCAATVQPRSASSHESSIECRRRQGARPDTQSKEGREACLRSPKRASHYTQPQLLALWSALRPGSVLNTC